jgi:hypothetical protein
MSNGYTEAYRNAIVDYVAPNYNSGYIRLYGGARPANSDAAITTQNLIVTLRFAASAFAAASGGEAVANAVSSGVSIYSPSATASWARISEDDGTTTIRDIDVNTTGADLNIANTLIPLNSTVNCTSLLLRMP